MVDTARGTLATLCSLTLAAQGPTMLEAHVVLPRVAHLGVVVVSGDVDGDGITDHVSAASNSVLIGTAAGGFVERPDAFVPPINVGSPRFALADLDGDGDLDVALLGWALVLNSGWSSFVWGGNVNVYLNDGSGVFLAAGMLGSAAVGEITADVAAGDVDGDGDADLVVAVQPLVFSVPNGIWLPPSVYAIGGQNRLWLNQGNGTFVDATNRLPTYDDGTTSVSLVDLDGDGDRDIYFGNTQTQAMIPSANQDRILRNQGNGWFVHDPTFVPGPTHTAALHALDFDADGDVDVLVHDSAQPRFLRNSGAAVFTVESLPVTLPASSTMVVGDFDADGLVDFGVSAPTSWVPVRNVAGTFTAVTAASEPLANNEYHSASFLIDMEGDGDLDLLLGPTPNLRARWLRNDAGVPHRTVVPDLPEAVTAGRAIAIGDIDGDGDPDLLLAASGRPGRCYLNDGHGGFTSAPAGDFTQMSTYSVSLQLADFDGDGDLDAAVGTTANASVPNVILYWNQGGVLTQQVLPFAASDEIIAGDLDGDGDVDIYTSPWIGNDVVLTNLGGGTFAIATGAVPPGVRTQYPRLADLDGDGDLDVIGSAIVLRNDGTGSFAVIVGAGVSGSGIPVAGDFDGDLDVDALVDSTLYRNDGTGSFAPTATSVPLTSQPARGIAQGDLDGDGDLDVLRTRASSPLSPASLFVNDGSGAFTPQPANAGDTLTVAQDLKLADLDGDGDLDAVVASGGTPRIWWNRTRHLSWRSLPRVGWPLVLDVEGPANASFALALAFAPARLPILGFGTLRLDPASLAVVAAGCLDHAGRAVFQQPVPPVPALVGLTLYWQALTGSPTQLGNLETTTFLAQ